jgi:small-conductance mechanosensitive channel
MNSADGGLRGFFVKWTTPENLAAVIAVAVTALIAVIAAQAFRTWYYRRHAAPAQQATWQGRVIEGAVVVAPILFALVMLLIVRGSFGVLGMRAAIVDTALQLITALLLVRFGVYLLRLLLGQESWIRAWETHLTLALWLVIGFELVGWFDTAERAIDSIDLIPGTGKFSLWALLKGVVVVTTFVIVTSLIARTIERRVMKLEALAVSTRIGISKFTYVFLLSLGILLGINATGVELRSLAFLTGGIGLGLGFGLQAIASNFVSGFVLLMDKSIKPGDVISFTGTTGTSTENFGWVQELRGRYVVVRDRDGVETLVPNQNLITNSVINWSYSDQRVRLRLPVMVSYDNDPELALRVLLEAAHNHPRILREPGPVSRLMSFEDYGMRVEVRFWIADPMNGVNNVRSDVNRAIWKLFKENGIKIPVAQREIRMVSDAFQAPGLRLSAREDR